MPRYSACRSRFPAPCRTTAPAARPTSPAASSPAGRPPCLPAPAPRRQPGRRCRGAPAAASGGGAGCGAVAGAPLLWLAGGSLGEGRVLPLGLALATVPVFALQDYLQAIARSQNWPVLAILPPYIIRQGLVGAAMVAAVAFGAPAEPAVAVGCTLIATAAAVIVQGLALLRRLDPALLSGNRRYPPREWAAATLPMGFADLTLILFNSIDVLVLGLFVPADAVGVYFAATRIVQLVLFAQYAATAATAPRFAEASARGDDAALRALVRGTVRLTAGASLALGAGLLLVAPWLLDLFGAGFGAGFGALAILVCGAAVQSSFGPAEDLLNMLGAERVASRVSFAALALAVTLNFALIPSCCII